MTDYVKATPISSDIKFPKPETKYDIDMQLALQDYLNQIYNALTNTAEISTTGLGDMLAATYDPTPVAGDAFDMDNMVNGMTNKVFTATEQTKLTGIEYGAEVNNISDINATDLTDGGSTTLHSHSVASHTIASHSDTTATGAELNTLVGGGETSLHSHAAASAAPSGIIVMWSGAISSIPSGWVICDGTNSTPNLTDRFIIHADADSGGTNNVGDTGGANSFDNSHTHSGTSLGTNTTGSHNHGSLGNYPTGYGVSGGTTNAGSHSHSITGSTGSAGSSTQSTIPKYYALAYIMKT